MSIYVMIAVIMPYMFRTSGYRCKRLSFPPLSSSTSSIRDIPLTTTTTTTDIPVEYDVDNIDHHFMKLAIRHAQFAFREKEVPIG
jgi:hypothetical protein